MQDTARDVARKVPASLDEVGTAVADLNTNLGLTGPVLDTVASQVLEAGRMLGEDIDIKNAASTLNGFNVAAEETPDALDDIFRVSQATGTSMNDLTGQLSTQSGVLSELGLGLGDSAALIGGLSKAGIDSNAVLKGMGRSMTKLAKDGEPTADTFNRVMGELQGFIDTGDTAAAMDLATDLFGTRAAPQFIAALESGVLNMEDLMGATGATQDTILGLADETRTAGQQWDILKNNAMLALEPIGTVIFGAVGDALGALAQWISTIDFTPIQTFADQIGPALGELGGQLGELLLPVLERMGPALTGMLEGGMPLTGMLDQLWPAVESIGQAFMDAMPVILEFGESLLPLIGGAVEAIIPLLMDIAETAIPAVMGIIEEVLPIVQNILETVVPAVIGAVEELVPKILEIVDPVMEIVSTLLDYLAPAVEFILPIVVGIFDALVTQISGAIDIIVAVLETVSNLLKGDWSAAWESIKGVVDGAITFVQGIIDQGMAIISGITGQTIDDIKRTFRDGWALIVDTVKTKAGDLIGEVKALPGKIKDGLGNMANLLKQAGKDLIQGMINGIGSMGQALKDKASGLAGGAVDAIKGKLGIASPSKVMQQVGVWTGEGLIQGVEKMQRGAAGAMADLVTVPDAPRIGVQAAGRSARSDAQHLHIHIEGAFVGDRIGLAREIEQILADRRALIGAA
ncbi:phage tail tape measure protein [Brachybacterium massiliense]|uniref:phage tail tape measure protein n=1 Tax=Brachybacterium massiliense TaxID=1755098 RepID=UPI003CCB8E92